jgi:hypothetical protein
MPLPRESVLKVYRGTRLLGLSRPILVVTGDTTHDQVPFSEFYVFHRLKDVPFLFGRTRCGVADEIYPFDFGNIPEVFSAAALLASEFQRARDRIELEVSERDRDLFRDLYCSGSPLAYEETNDLPLVEFKLFRQFEIERGKMFEFSRSRLVMELREKLRALPEAALHNEPKAAAETKR